MRIGLDYRPATGFPNSGIGRQNLALEQALRAHPGTSLQLFSVAPAGHAIRRRAHCPRWDTPLDGLHRLPERFKFEACFLPGALHDAGIDTYICNFNMGLPLARKPAGMKYVLQLHDLFQLTLANAHGSRLKARVYGYTDRASIAWSVRQADRIWTPSQYTADETARLFPAARDKLRVLPNLVTGFSGEPGDLSAFGLPERYWLLVGTREPRKNIPWFVSAWRDARNRHPDIPDLVLVGAREHLPPPLQHLHGLHFVAGVSDAQLQGLYRQALRLWQPSYAEGFGLPVIEALGEGTPVAVATGSSLDEICPPGTPRFSPTDSDALVALMGALAQPDVALDIPSLREWARGYGPQAYQQRIDTLLEELR